MIKQKIQLGMDNIVFAGALGMENHYMPKASGAIENPKNIEGVVFSSVTTCGSAKDPIANEFCKRFKAKWDFEPSTSGAEGSNYDAIYMIKKAIEKTNSLDPTEIAKAIKTLNYRGASGTYRFNEQGDSLFSSDVVTFGDKINVILLKEKKQ
jgi:ABC-type branched-subunit amino acid transport system substrate-binding protein